MGGRKVERDVINQTWVPKLASSHYGTPQLGLSHPKCQIHLAEYGATKNTLFKILLNTINIKLSFFTSTKIMAGEMGLPVPCMSKKGFFHNLSTSKTNENPLEHFGLFHASGRIVHPKVPPFSSLTLK